MSSLQSCSRSDSKCLKLSYVVCTIILLHVLPTGSADLPSDVILSPNPQRTFSGKYLYFQPRMGSAKGESFETTTKVPWEEPLKLTANIALGNAKINKNAILKASYNGFIDSPTFGDISVLAKGKLKKNSNKTYSFEQINDRCDEKCKLDADKYLENVTALWMVERIRHRENNGLNPHFDLKFTIVPIYSDNKHQIDQNILEDRLKSHMKRTFLLRDLDYPNYFKSNRRTDLFSPSFERSFQSFMNINPTGFMNSIIQGMTPTPSKSSATPKNHIKDNRLNKGEFYVAPKIMNSGKSHFHQSINGHANHIHDHRVRFPDSREMTSKTPINLYRPKPELYTTNNLIDYRGANDNIFVGTHEHHQQQPIAVPVIQFPMEMPLIQLAQSPYAFPVQLQLSTPHNHVPIYPQPDVTTFRYHPQLISLPNHHHHQQPAPELYNQFVPFSLVTANETASKPFHESARHTMNHYSPPDPVYHHSDHRATEAPKVRTTTLNSYSNIVRQQIGVPVISTASSLRVENYEDGDFVPILPSYATTKPTKKPNSVKDVEKAVETTTSVYESFLAKTSTSEKTNEISYDVIEERQKKATEKPILKWTPKKIRNKLTTTTSTTTTTTTTPEPFIPTLPTTDAPPTTTQQSPSSKFAAQISRGRQRYNRRNSSSLNSAKASTISPQITTKMLRKKTPTTSASTLPLETVQQFYPSTLFPTYMTTLPPGDEAVTVQSLSTSISLEVNGERVTTSTPGYELIPAGVESVKSNSSNVKIFKAAAVPEKFDDFTFSILNHAKAIESNKNDN